MSEQLTIQALVQLTLDANGHDKDIRLSAIDSLSKDVIHLVFAKYYYIEILGRNKNKKSGATINRPPRKSTSVNTSANASLRISKEFTAAIEKSRDAIADLSKNKKYELVSLFDAAGTPACSAYAISLIDTCSKAKRRAVIEQAVAAQTM